MNTIVCPNCKNEIDLPEAISHKMREEALAKVSTEHKEELEKQKKEVEEKAELKIKADLDKVRQEAQKEMSDKNKASQLELLEAQKKQKLLEEKLQSSEKNQRENEDKIKQEAMRNASDKFRLDKLEYEKKIADMQKAADEVQRKGKQGSQQLQGEVLELDLEDNLKRIFIYDEFKPVPKGIKGGDILQKVRNKFGNSAGSILWETKRQQDWKKIWLVKLKEDMRKIGASDCILVTDVLPSNTKFYDRVDNVWVTSYEHAIKLANVIRFGILNLAIARSSASHSDEQLRNLYKIITSDSFRHKFEARDEIVISMRKELDSEISSAERRWSRQKGYIDKLSRNNNQLYNELQAHIPSLKPLGDSELLELADGDLTRE